MLLLKQWPVKEVIRVGTEKEGKDIQKAMLYDIRLIVKGSEKETYTKEELLDLLDTIAVAKYQE